MNEMYSEVREDLRRQHAMNTQEIQGKNIDNSYKYGYYEYDRVQGDTSSCYLYGGQDVKKGAVMAWNDMHTQITKLEEEEPAVKQAMRYMRKAYEEVKDFTKTYINVGE